MPDYAAQMRLADEKMRRRLVTPEGVDLSLRLASRSQRLAAFVLDLMIMAAVLVGITIFLTIALVSSGGYGAQLIFVVWLLGFFLLRNGYFIIMELGPRAATFGKRANGLRVVARSGARLTADAVIARNLLREIEFYLPLSFLLYRSSEGTADAWMSTIGLAWACIFLFFPMFNKDGLRVGDLLAGTWVISAPQRVLGAELLEDRSEAPDFHFTDEQIDAYGVFELQTLEKVLREGHPEAMSTVSWTIRQKLGIGDVSTDYEFLSAYYAALRARLERKLLFGRRRLDKHDL
jgi:uncharacterized RDD family membrane protein YckC